MNAGAPTRVFRAVALIAIAMLLGASDLCLAAFDFNAAPHHRCCAPVRQPCHESRCVSSPNQLIVAPSITGPVEIPRGIEAGPAEMRSFETLTPAPVAHTASDRCVTFHQFRI
jgi:hypothetical protein